MNTSKVAEVNSSAEIEARNVNDGDGIHQQNNGKTLLNLGQITAIPYTKEGDKTGFLRLRIVGKTAVNGIICQVTGYITQIKGEVGT